MTAQMWSRRTALKWSCCAGGPMVAWAALGAGMPASLLAQEKTAIDAALPGKITRPAIDTDEGGLWALMDREETRTRRSPFLVRDAALQRYVQDIVCKLGGEHCLDARVYIVRTPIFNATMAPNGMMQIWSGLLLRVENEAQLAAVLGHELGHFMERHSVEQLRGLRDRAALAQFLGLFGAVGALGQLGVLANAMAFSREHETRADQMGMRLMKRAGYDGAQAAKVWDNLLAELKVTGGEDAGKRSPMMATHPPVANRRDELLALAGDGGGRLGFEEFQLAVKPHRMSWLHDEVRRGQFEESVILFGRMLQSSANDPQVLFARGEVYRLRDNADDLDVALQDLLASAQHLQAPSEVWRSIGLIHKKRAQAPQAVEAFEKYLARWADAPDSELIKHYILELKT